MKTIAIMNQKGGTGKTTSAINLAGELVRRGKKVLIVDTDTQGNATSNLELTEVSKITLSDIIVDKDHRIPDAICHTSIEGLDLIRGGSLLAPALAAMQEMPFGRDMTLKRLVPQIPKDYDFVFFDCSPSLESLFNINVLVAVQYILIPIKVDKNSIEGYNVMLETVQNVRAGESRHPRAGYFHDRRGDRRLAGPGNDREFPANAAGAGVPQLHSQKYRRKKGPAGAEAPVLLLPPLHRHGGLRRALRRNAGTNGGLRTWHRKNPRPFSGRCKRLRTTPPR